MRAFLGVKFRSRILLHVKELTFRNSVEGPQDFKCSIKASHLHLNFDVRVNNLLLNFKFKSGSSAVLFIVIISCEIKFLAINCGSLLWCPPNNHTGHLFHEHRALLVGTLKISPANMEHLLHINIEHYQPEF